MATSPPRLLLVHANAEWYGSDRSFVLLATGLRDRGWDVTAVVPAPGPAADRLRDAGVPVLEADPGVPRPRAWSRGALVRWAAWSAPRSCLRMWRLARSHDLVHLNTSTILGGAVGAVLARRPLVVHVREHLSPTSRWSRAFARVLRRFAVVVAISRDVAANAAAAGFGDRVTMIHNGLAFDPPVDRHDHGVLQVGRINRWKGQDVLVEAIGALRGRGVDVPVVVAGDPFPGDEQLVDDLRRRMDDLGVAHLVELAGYVDDVASLYARASIFVSPTTDPEPFGLALLDAMAAGLAPIATDAGGPRDMVRSGETGLLVPSGDVDALADAIEWLWLRPAVARSMGEAAAADVRARFQIDRTVAEVEALYRRILDP